MNKNKIIKTILVILGYIVFLHSVTNWVLLTRLIELNYSWWYTAYNFIMITIAFMIPLRISKAILFAIAIGIIIYIWKKNPTNKPNKQT